VSLTSRVANLFSSRNQSIYSLDELIEHARRGGGRTTAGRDVTVDSALRDRPSWAAIRNISQDIGSLPCILYRRTPDGGKTRAVDNRLYSLLHDAPNNEMTAFDFWSLVVVHVLMKGNHYSQLILDDAGVREIWPLSPALVKPKRDPTTNALYYEFKPNSQTTVYLDFNEVFHVHDLSYDGLNGLAPMDYASESIGFSLAAEEYGARLFGQGTRPPGILTAPRGLSDEALLRIKDQWNEVNGGLENAHKVPVLEEGLAWQATGVPNDQAQFLELRQYQVAEASRTWRIPPHKIADLSRATFSNIESQDLDYYKSTLRPILVNIEQAISRDMIKVSDGKRNHVAEFLVDAILRADSTTRNAAYHNGRLDGWLNADEIRAMENRNPIPDGKGEGYWTPVNVTDSTAPPPPAPAEPATPANLPDTVKQTAPVGAVSTNGRH
jgi:HK97 family phage portal protein